MPFFPRSPSRSNPSRRRDDGDEVRTLTFDVESFEFIAAGEEVGLLRLSGRWIAAVERVLHDVTLVAAHGDHSVDVMPLPDLEGSAPMATPDGAPWRAAFSVSSELALNEGTQFSLAVQGGERIALPGLGDLSAPVVEASVPDFAAEVESPPAAAVDADELTRLRAELEQARTDLEVERRRHESLEEEIRSHTILENDLRSAMALQEAELNAAVAQAAQRAKRAERQRDRAGSTDARPNHQGRPVDAGLLDRLERARRAAEAAA